MIYLILAITELLLVACVLKWEVVQTRRINWWTPAK